MSGRNRSRTTTRLSLTANAVELISVVRVVDGMSSFQSVSLNVTR